MEKEITYGRAHYYLYKNFSKTGFCSDCKRLRNNTQWSLQRGKKYSLNIKDYRERCIPCHNRYDKHLRHPNIRKIVDIKKEKEKRKKLTKYLPEIIFFMETKYKLTSVEVGKILNLSPEMVRYYLRER